MGLLRSDPWPAKKHVEVLGARMAFAESGQGRPIVFLHGNPTSSMVWRSVLPQVSGRGRCIAFDLIGMGDSSKVGSGASSYRFLDHRTYVDAFMSVLGIESDVILVGHEWGAALMFDWAARHPDAVAGLVYMEALVTPLRWEDWPERSRSIQRALRSEAGDELVLAKNLVVERLLPATVLEPIPEPFMEEYRRPYASVGEDRRPTLTLTREVPIEGEPAAVATVVAGYQRWLERTPVPKLFVNGDPGYLLVGRQREVCRRFPNQTEVTVPGLHHLPEDSGPAIGRAIVEWLDRL
ncbi:MAG: haloalkane dehalogenase [Acidimicrobiia bacterium]